MPVSPARPRHCGPAIRLSAAGVLLGSATVWGLAVPAAADETPTTTTNVARGPEVLTWHGGPVEGTATGDGPELPVGDSTDTLRGEDDIRHYQVKRTVTGSTLRVAVVTETRASGGDLGLKATPVDDPDTSCPSAGDYNSGPGLLSTEIVLEPSGSCGNLGAFRLELEGGTSGSGSAMMLRFTEEPPMTSTGAAGTSLSSLAEAPAVQGAKKPVTGGTSPATAPGIGAGRWSSALVPGETRLYRIPLAYGESLRVGANFEALTDAQQSDLETSSVGTDIALLDPMLGRLDPPDGANTNNYVGDETLFTGTGSVNRGIDQVLSSGSTTLAGNYYLAVTADDVSGKSIELPFTLDVAVLGKPTDGPTYAGEATWTVASQVTPVTGEDLTEGERSAALGETPERGLPVASLATGATGLLLIMGGVTWLLRRRYSTPS